jgi:methionyl-tRNA synthetase
MSDKTFYVTTPIYYVNARPHIGHAYTTIVADVLARRHRLLGEDTFFLTGTDEHGQKIERSAAAAGIPPQQFADQVSKSFEDLWKRMGITNNDYIRTTSDKHKLGVQHLFSELYARGFIYLASYTGSYCVSDEAFVDAPVGTPCPDCGRLLEEVTEENFFFKLSEFQQPIIDLIESNTIAITPDSRRNEVLSFLRGGLKDLSISRSSFTWGIPVPEPAASTAEQKHVIYVWLDALANYMTALGYGSDDETLFKKFWPADLHLVGKEIIRFHCVYWPAFLLALNPQGAQTPGAPGLASETWASSEAQGPQLTFEQHKAWAEQWLPKAITAHGWLLFEDSKMSKSKGNIVRTETILDAFGTLCPPQPSLAAPDTVILSEAVGGSSPAAQPKDPEAADAATTAETLSTENPTHHHRDLFASDVLRYFLLREIPFGQDGSFSFDALITRYNADLANGYGNLVSRTLSMIGKYFDGRIPDQVTSHQPPQGVTSLPIFAKYLDALDFSRALERVWSSSIAYVDNSISVFEPWKVAARGTETDYLALGNFLYGVAESIRWITALLHPILPYATARVWAQLGLGDIEAAARNGELNNLTWGGLQPGTQLGPLGPIFPRADKGLAQIMTDMENPTPVDTSSIDPAAAPRTTTFPEIAALPVGGSNALTTGPDPTKPAPEPSATASPAPVEAAQITIDDFAKIELRVAQILVAERIPKADKLLRLEVDLGPDFPRRQILSGIAEWYAPEDLVGRRIVVITNLAPRKMRGLESHGMLLAASHGENGKPVLATFGEHIALGSRLK